MMTVKGWWLQLAVVACLLATSVGLAPKQGEAIASSPDEAVTIWEIETVDAAGAVGSYASLALDTEGNPLISYYDDTADDLKLARFGGTTWEIETVDDGLVYPCPTSLALDSDGHPHISYCILDMSGGSDLWYAVYDGASWQREVVTLETTPCAGLVIDSAGGPHIAFQAGYLKYATRGDGSWPSATVDGTPGAGLGLSLVLDAGDNPHISYLDGGSDQVKYAWHDGAGWQVSPLDDGMSARGRTSLALDGLGYPHIAYGSYYLPTGFQGLAYTYFDGTTWHPGIADSAGDGGWHASLVLDAAGRPQISHFDAETGQLKVAYHGGMGWHTEIVDSDGTVGEYSSLALDEAGQPHIAYYDASHTHLKRAYAPFIFRRIAAQLLEDVRGTSMAPGWEQAQLAISYRPLYRPDVAGIAYYEFPVEVPAADSRLAAMAPAGYILVSTGDHDFTIPHWSFGGVAPTEELIAQAEANGQEAVTFFQFNDNSFAAENGDGDLVATLGALPYQLTGMDPGWLVDPPGSWSATWVPDRQMADQPVMPDISGTLVISGPTTLPPIDWNPWSSWQELKDGFADAFYVPLEALRLGAQEEWEVKNQIARDGIALRKGDVHTMALLWPGVETFVSGPGAAYVTTQLLPRDPLPPALQITAVDSELGQTLPLDVVVAYENGMTEVLRYQIIEPYRAALPLVQREAGKLPLALAPLAAPQRPEDGYGLWHYYWAGTHADQRLYGQIDEGESPNTSECVSGCGATAWAMLYGWVDYKAAQGNDYWKDRWGIYRTDGGFGEDEVAPLWMNVGVMNMTWEIRNDIHTQCDVPSQVGPDLAYTLPWDMKYSEKYVRGRSCVTIKSQWDAVPTKKNRNRAIHSIVERRTPAIMMTTSMDHYQLAYGYAWRCWYSAGNCLWREHWFYVNQGWEGYQNKWVNRYMTHYVGRIYPCSGCASDVAIVSPVADLLSFDYGHDGTTDAQRPSVVPLDHFRFVAGDFDGDGDRDDMGWFWNGLWWFDYNSDVGTFDEFVDFGQAGDLPAAGDFDRDGFVDDVAVYRPSELKWYFDYNHDGITDEVITLGCNGCLPAAGDFNRDGFVDDVALYKDVAPNWAIDLGHDGIVDQQVTFGCAGCLPLASDFDCDGHPDDTGLYNPATYMWYYDYDYNGTLDETVGPWGAVDGIPVAGSFDN